MIKNIGVLGGRGFAGQEILRLLSDHPHMYVTRAYSSSQAGESVQGYSKNASLVYTSLDLQNLELGMEDAYILALPNKEASPYIDQILAHNSAAVLLDLSSDYRFDDAWQYRLPELSGPVSSTKISNPGCYATAMQLMLAPLVDRLQGPANFFGISGFSGAGASPNTRNNQDLLAENILAYSLVNHPHEQEVKKHMYKDIFFTPHVAEFFRGIHMTANVVLTKPLAAAEAELLFNDYFKTKPLIQVQTEAPNLQQTRDTSFAYIGGFESDTSFKRLTFCCTIDNLLKGAATQAVQNLNSAFGWDDNLGIIE
jgi:N-acetyl-gamma-glutamyl-phosphate reductase